MIAPEELRIGNLILEKVNNKITMIRCGHPHLEKMWKAGANDFYPVILKPEILEKCGFTENKNYALLPDAREFSLALPVIGKNKNAIVAYIKNNKECFARATVDQLPASNNIYQLHQLQNLYFSLTGEELLVKL